VLTGADKARNGSSHRNAPPIHARPCCIAPDCRGLGTIFVGNRFCPLGLVCPLVCPAGKPEAGPTDSAIRGNWPFFNGGPPSGLSWSAPSGKLGLPCSLPVANQFRLHALFPSKTGLYETQEHDAG